MKISIAMATFNGAKYLQEQLDSILKQELQPDELVVSDDCSTDDTLNILRDFSLKAPFKVIIKENTENLGYGGNFNRALLMTSGDLVFLSDQDDVWFPEKIKVVTEIAANDTRNLVFMNDTEIVRENLQRTGLTSLKQIASIHASESKFVVGCSAAIKREFLNFALPVPESCRGHDSWLIGLAIALDRRWIIRQPLQLYRRHDRTTSNALIGRTRKASMVRSLSAPLCFRANKDLTQQLEIYLTVLEEMATLSKRNLSQTSIAGFDDDLRRLVLSKTEEAEIIKTRISIRKSQWISRVINGWKAYRAGIYYHERFNGFRSFLADIKN